MWLSLYKIYSSSEILLGVEVKTRLVGQSQKLKCGKNLLKDTTEFKIASKLGTW